MRERSRNFETLRTLDRVAPVPLVWCQITLWQTECRAWFLRLVRHVGVLLCLLLQLCLFWVGQLVLVKAVCIFIDILWVDFWCLFLHLLRQTPVQSQTFDLRWRLIIEIDRVFFIPLQRWCVERSDSDDLAVGLLDNCVVNSHNNSFFSNFLFVLVTIDTHFLFR